MLDALTHTGTFRRRGKGKDGLAHRAGCVHERTQTQASRIPTSAPLVADDGFFFGLGAFETIALEQGVPLFLREHLHRMRDALSSLGIEVSRDELVGVLRSACVGDALRGRKALKLTVTEANRLASVRENLYDIGGSSDGFRCELSEVRRNESSPLTSLKTLNYGENILLKRECAARGINEPLFLNCKGQVAEGATSNIFAVFGDELVTPPLSCGLLPGVMRSFALRVLGAKERIILPEELFGADEVFLTNSLMGAQSVQSIGENTFAGNTASRLLNEAYGREVERESAAWKEARDPWEQLFES